MSELKAEKQELFCKEYIKDFNASRSAKDAGYSEKTAGSTGHELLKKPEIQARLAELMKERNDRTQIDADWVLYAAKRVYDRCMQDEPILDRDGNAVMCKTESGELAAAYRFDASGANKALETIGKHVNVKAFNGEPKQEGDGIIHSVKIEVVGASKNISD